MSSVFTKACTLVIAIAGLLVVPAEASSIRGFVSIQSSQVFLLPVSSGTRLTPRPLPVVASIAIRTSLLDLKTGDFVIVSGSLSDTNHDGLADEIVVDGIESVGLKDVIGTWRSDKWEVVRFEDFSRMSLYRPKFRSLGDSQALIGKTAKNPGLHLAKRGFSKLKDLNYTLAPEQGSSYSIFLVEKTASGGPAPVFAGRLDVQKRALKLEIYDPKTGASSEVLSLSPVHD